MAIIRSVFDEIVRKILKPGARENSICYDWYFMAYQFACASISAGALSVAFFKRKLT